MRLLNHPCRTSFTAILAAAPVVLFLLAGAGTANAQAAAPPDVWTQFRGTASLTGVSSATVPEEPKLLWSFEVGESNRLVGRHRRRHRLRRRLYRRARRARPPHRRGEVALIRRASEWASANRRPPSDTGSSSSVTSAGVLHAVDAETGEAVWTYATLGEIKSSPVLAEDRVLIGSYDGYLYGLDAVTGELAWQVETQKLRPRHRRPSPGASPTFGGCDEMFHGVRISDGAEGHQRVGRCVHGGPPRPSGTDAPTSGRFDNEVHQPRLGDPRRRLALRAPAATLPLLLVGAQC